jgi:hypothetical protein
VALKHEGFSMCWSKHEREEWERLQREGDSERLLTISAIESDVESRPRAMRRSRSRGELIRV